jgi:16S rRNA (cytidine1402-2'-O)-methyltransferase
MLIEKATLYIVATPIGNLSDITFRAVEVLSKVDLIAAEDTRRSRTLLMHYEIHTPVISMHQHNEKARTEQILGFLKTGQSIALISDAGTPLISDPGYQLVSLVQQTFNVVTIPGVCALTAALSVAGLPTHQFCFEGFLSAKPRARFNRLKALTKETRTMVFYETPHRIDTTVMQMLEIFGPHRQAVIARELTKTFEQVSKDTLANLVEKFNQHLIPSKGEFVILIAGHKSDQTLKLTQAVSLTRILQSLMESVSLKQAVDLTQRITGQSRTQIYTLALGLKKEKEVSR